MNILVLYYSQSGRTQSVIDLFISPLKSRPYINLDVVEVEPERPFPSPWPMLYFFSIMPETVYESPIAIKEPKFDGDKKYDLIILGSQVWFLAPSLPISSFFGHKKSSVFRDTPVVLVLTCRKMWLQTLKSIETKLKSLNSSILDKIVLCVKGSQRETLYSTRENLFKDNKTARAEKIWSYDKNDLDQITKQGEDLAEYLDAVNRGERPAKIFKEESHAISQKSHDSIERATKNSFLFWGGIIKKISNPGSALRNLLSAIFTAFFLTKIMTFPFIEMTYRAKNFVFREK